MPGLFWAVGIQQLIKGEAKIQMQAFWVQGPWLFTATLTRVFLASDEYVWTDTRVCSERLQHPKGRGEKG